jgi:drug/metabolite transporter (DMT)-like permease
LKVSNKTTGYISIVLASILWGTTYPTIKFGLSQLELTPLTYLSMRFLFALLSLSPLLIGQKFRKEVDRLIFKVDIIIIGLLNGAGYSLQFIGQSYVTAGLASIMVNTYVIFTPIFLRSFFKQAIAPGKKYAAIIGFVGTIVIAFGRTVDSEANIGTLFGIVMVLGAGIVYALYIVFAERAMKPAYRDKKPNSAAVFYASSIYSLLLIVITGGILKDLPGLTPFPPVAIIPIAYLGIFCTGGAFILYLFSLRELGSVDSAVYLLLIIVVGILLSFFTLNEVPDSYMYGGGSLIFFSIYLVHHRTIR